MPFLHDVIVQKYFKNAKNFFNALLLQRLFKHLPNVFVIMMLFLYYSIVQQEVTFSSLVTLLYHKHSSLAKYVLFQKKILFKPELPIHWRTYKM